MQLTEVYPILSETLSKCPKIKTNIKNISEGWWWLKEKITLCEQICIQYIIQRKIRIAPRYFARANRFSDKRADILEPSLDLNFKQSNPTRLSF